METRLACWVRSFFFNDTATTEIYTLSLHDALPISFGGMSYNQAIKADHDFTVDNVDAALNAQHLDAIVSATDNPAWATDLVFGDHFIFGTSSIAAAGGYPIVQVPAGEVFGVPLGISFFGTAFSEPKLTKLASGYEAFTHARAHNLPTFAATVPFDHIKGPLQQSTEGAAAAQAAAAVPSSGAAPAAQAAAATVASPSQVAGAKVSKALHHL